MKAALMKTNVSGPNLYPPVAGGPVVNSHSAIGQSIAKPAAMHMAK